MKGKVFGRLTVTSEPFMKQNPSGRNIPWVRVKCECGTKKPVRLWKLTVTDEPLLSCGCLQRERFREAMYTHRQSGTRMYQTWQGMNSRCYNQNRKAYENYGAKGIRVCDEWRNDFAAFHSWSLINGYTDDMTIDRIDPKKNYTPDNCRWVTMAQNIGHKNSRYITAFGETKNLKDWASDPRCKVSYNNLKVRTRKPGVDPEKVILNQLRAT